MINLIKDSCIRIPGQHIREQWLIDIVESLTRECKQYDPNLENSILKFFDVDKARKEIMIPRFYQLPLINCKIESDDTPEGEDIQIESRVNPRNARQKMAIDWMSSKNNGILCMQPGEGKTVVAIASIANRKKKTIIFVHKDKLADQWVERFLQHSNLTLNDISRLQTSKYEEQLRNPIVISTVQTFCSMIKRLPNIRKILLDANFGMAIWDECHTSVSAHMFSKSSLYLPCKYVFGLSATPRRSDGNDDIMRLHLGETFIPNIGTPDTMIPKIVIIKFDFKIMSSHAKYILHNTSWDKKQDREAFFDSQRYYKFFCRSKSYVSIVQKIIHQVSKSDRTALALSHRIDILDMASKACVNQSEVGFFIPRSGKLRGEHLKRKMVFSTYGSAKDGTDKASLDCLILLTPVGNIEQAVGRTVRKHLGKQQPVVLDIVDTGCNEMIKRLNRRIDFYNRKNWIVEERSFK